MNKKSVLVLASGGIDSTVLLKHYLDKGWDVSALLVNHSQPRLTEEYHSFWGICELLGIDIKVYRVAEFKYDKFFGPVRNAFLLTIAENVAYHMKIPYVAIGMSLGEYLDTRPEFIDRFNFMLDFCLRKPIYVLAPFAHWSKERVIKYGLKIDAPLHLTTSCMDSPPCGKCQDCRLRAKYGIDTPVSNSTLRLMSKTLDEGLVQPWLRKDDKTGANQ